MRAHPPRPALPRARPPPLLLLLLAALLHYGGASGVFELQVLQFSNYRLQLASGACCGGGAPASPCTAPCRTRFALCLKEYQAAGGGAGPCSFGRAASPALGTDSFTLTDPLYTLALPFTFRWTRSFTLILQAYDDFNYTDSEKSGLLEEAWWSGIVEPGAEWHALRHEGSSAAVAYRVRVLCQPNYYNSTCTTFCRPRDDQFGHYACSPAGAKTCLQGWRGDNCDIPVCKEGCHPTHGRCDRPGDCDCRPGWRGEQCDLCQPYPGCKHGYCNGSSWDCTCDTNWGGILCDQDLNYCGTHEPCQHGGTCENTAPDQYLCTCAEGFSGSDCERVDNPCAPGPCRHGACSLATAAPGYSCACEPGWTGPACDQDVDDCLSQPCLNGAHCRDLVNGFECECAVGWSGTICDRDLDECAATPSPCVNAAACTNSPGAYSCACMPGWTGHDCAHNVDDCAGQCLNSATCIDLVDDFHCACAPGYTGRTCSRDIDECSSRPCRNGGECVDLVDAYRCICPVGFAGHDCELSSCFGRYCQDDRDHCADRPCGNGAACYNAQSDYYCHCAPGWTGKNCTVRSSPPLAEAPDLCVGASACKRGRCARSPPAAPRCVCELGFGGALCDLRLPSPVLDGSCTSEPCLNNSTCIDGPSGFTCACADGWSGKTCNLREEGAWCAGACQHGGSCVRGAAGWECSCVSGRAGARCEREEDGCASAPCQHGGRCVGGAGWWACECAPGWAGPACAARAAPAPCAACPSAAACVRAAPHDDYRCLCPAPPVRAAMRCLEQIATEESDSGVEISYTAEIGGECGVSNGSWWWGCNVCWCGEGGGARCTRLWCGLPDCGAAHAAPCRADEVCVPTAPALCLRAPCAAPAECRRVSARRVAAPALPAPPSCWPGSRAAPAPPCARLLLELARERLSRGAHVERACSALRRALAVALAPRTTPLALLCDLAPDDDDMLDLALWVGEEEGAAGAEALSAAVRALHELVAGGRLGGHALLGAALRLRVPAAGAEAAASGERGSWVGALCGGLASLLVVAALVVAAVLLWRRRRAETERARHCDEEKSNNLQNEENLRRYANPLRESPTPLSASAGALYKPVNADARNNAPADCVKRAPPPPPERLTVLV